MVPKKTLPRLVVVLTLLAGTTFLYFRVFHVNPTTVALTFLVMVLLCSAFWGSQVAVVTAICSTAVFNFFFLPPVGTFTISDPQNWIALFAFLITGLVASNLAERARREAEHALQRRREVERLYSLSQQLLTSENPSELFNALPQITAHNLEADGVALVVKGSETIYRSRPELEFDEDLLKSTVARGEISRRDNGVYIPLRLGVRPVGALAIIGTEVSRETLEAIGSLIGIASERASAVEELARTQASQESERLRAALLDSVTHEFRTPLTGIKASVTGLLDGGLEDAERHELLTVINEETDRLDRLVGEAAEMAQLDANMFTLDLEPHSVADVVEAALSDAKNHLQNREVKVEGTESVPEVSFDFERIREVLVHLLENAAKYSDSGKPIHISAEASKNDVSISVADRGPGIDSMEQALIFDKFYRGQKQRSTARGTGMGLAISKVIVEAHGGKIGVVSQLGSGSVFTIRLPRRDRDL